VSNENYISCLHSFDFYRVFFYGHFICTHTTNPPPLSRLGTGSSFALDHAPPKVKDTLKWTINNAKKIILNHLDGLFDCFSSNTTYSQITSLTSVSTGLDKWLTSQSQL